MHFKKTISQLLITSLVLSACNSNFGAGNSTSIVATRPQKLSITNDSVTDVANIGRSIVEQNDVVYLSKTDGLIWISAINGVLIWRNPVKFDFSNADTLRQIIQNNQKMFTQLTSIKPDNDDAIYFDKDNDVVYFLGFNTNNKAQEWKLNLKNSSNLFMLQQFEENKPVIGKKSVMFKYNAIEPVVDLIYETTFTNNDGEVEPAIVDQFEFAYIKLPRIESEGKLNVANLTKTELTDESKLPMYIATKSNYTYTGGLSMAQQEYIYANFPNAKLNALVTDETPIWNIFTPSLIALCIISGGLVIYGAIKTRSNARDYFKKQIIENKILPIPELVTVEGGLIENTIFRDGDGALYFGVKQPQLLAGATQQSVKAINTSYFKTKLGDSYITKINSVVLGLNADAPISVTWLHNNQIKIVELYKNLIDDAIIKKQIGNDYTYNPKKSS